MPGIVFPCELNYSFLVLLLCVGPDVGTHCRVLHGLTNKVLCGSTVSGVRLLFPVRSSPATDRGSCVIAAQWKLAVVRWRLGAGGQCPGRQAWYLQCHFGRYSVDTNPETCFPGAVTKFLSWSLRAEGRVEPSSSEGPGPARQT